MLTIVTGSTTGKYFKFLIQILNNIIEVSNSKNIQIRIIVYNLGLNESEIKEIKLFQYVTLENFDFNKYPEHVSLEKYYVNFYPIPPFHGIKGIEETSTFCY